MGKERIWSKDMEDLEQKPHWRTWLHLIWGLKSLLLCQLLFRHAQVEGL